MTGGAVPAWRLYERLVAAAEADALSDGRLSITPNVKLTGAITGSKRQVDVLIDSRVRDGIDRRVLVDAKYRGRQLTVEDVEAFLGLMADCRAHRGVLVCPEGWSETAMRRAQQAVVVRIIAAAEIDDLDLNSWDLCRGRCAEENRPAHRSGWLLFDSVFHLGSPFNPLSAVAIGKCDGCHDFHVWCWDCGSTFALRGDEAEAKCSCERFWLTSIEDDGPDESPQDLKAVCLTCVFLPHGSYVTIDRRPLN